MSEKYKIHDPDALYFVTMTVVYWIDLFTRKEFRHIMVNALQHCQQHKGMVIHAWVLIPSHAHLIISSNGEPLSDILRDLKKYTNKQIIKSLHEMNESRKDWLLRAFRKRAEELKRVKSYKIWQDGNHPILLDRNEMIDQRLSYIHNNPVEAELVDEPEYYWYSSARNYAGKNGLIEISLL